MWHFRFIIPKYIESIPAKGFSIMKLASRGCLFPEKLASIIIARLTPNIIYLKIFILVIFRDGNDLSRF